MALEDERRHLALAGGEANRPQRTVDDAGRRVGDHAYQAPAGTVAFVPRGTPHTFANTSEESSRSLVLVTPGGFERYFEELIALIEQTGGLPPEEELRELGIAHGSIPA